MKRRCFLAFSLAAGIFSSSAIQINQWSFEVNTPADLSNSSSSLTVADDNGNGLASGFHASTATDWTTPAGNGSANSFSANEWAIGDYFQFQVNTLGYQDITLSWNQTRSSTGPGVFDLAYSTDGSSFTVGLNNYTVSAIAWSSGSADSTVFSVDLSAIVALDNDASVYFRIVSDSSPSSSGGTSRIDNFVVNASAIPTPAPVPDSLPSGFAAVTLLGLVVQSRRLSFHRT
jgi:hypothetical protein